MKYARRIAASIAAALALGCRDRPRQAVVDTAGAFRPLVVGDAAPVMALRTLDGAPVSFGGEAGRVTLVNVWATWCTSCREEMADLEALHRTLSPHGLRIVAVSVDAGDDARVRRYVAHERLTFAVAHDPDGRVQDAYRVVGVPESFLLGRDGRLLWHQLGGVHGAVDGARDAAEQALGSR